MACIEQVKWLKITPKYIKFIGGENSSTKFEHVRWPRSWCNKYFFGIPNRGILWKIYPCNIKFLAALRVLLGHAPYGSDIGKTLKIAWGENSSTKFGYKHWIFLEEPAHQGKFAINKYTMENFQLSFHDSTPNTSSAVCGFPLSCLIFRHFRKKIGSVDYMHCIIIFLPHILLSYSNREGTLIPFHLCRALVGQKYIHCYYIQETIRKSIKMRVFQVQKSYFDDKKKPR